MKKSRYYLNYNGMEVLDRQKPLGDRSIYQGSKAQAKSFLLAARRQERSIVIPPEVLAYEPMFVGRTIQSILDDHYDGLSPLPSEIRIELTSIRPTTEWDKILVRPE